jgi:predicted ArsR family transcriptional regulator
VTTPAAAPGADVAPDRARLGVTQQRILEALDGASDDGLTTAQVADQVGIKATNAPRALKALRERGLIRGGDEKPAVWTRLSD